MSAGTPDTSLLSKLLRERMAAGLRSSAGKPGTVKTPPAEHAEQRSSAVIGALMRDTRDAYQQHHGTRQSDDQASASGATDAQATDLSAYILDLLESCEWPDWVSARCNFPDKGPYLQPNCDKALAAVARLTQQVFDDAGEDGDDLTVEIYTGITADTARLTVSGEFGLSMKTLKMIMQSRSDFEAIGGALITVREASNAGFEALIPAR